MDGSEVAAASLGVSRKASAAGPCAAPDTPSPAAVPRSC